MQAVAHPGLGGQVDRMTEFLLREQGFHARPVGQVKQDETKAGARFRQRLNLGQTILFQLDVIIIVAVVKAHHAVPVGKKPPNQMVADKACRAGHQNMHSRLPR